MPLLIIHLIHIMNGGMNVIHLGMKHCQQKIVILILAFGLNLV